MRNSFFRHILASKRELIRKTFSGVSGGIGTLSIEFLGLSISNRSQGLPFLKKIDISKLYKPENLLP